MTFERRPGGGKGLNSADPWERMFGGEGPQAGACMPVRPARGPGAAGALCRKVRMGGEEKGDGSQLGDQTY